MRLILYLLPLLAVAQTVNHGPQLFRPSATIAGARLECAALPSAPVNGDLACDSGDLNKVKVYSNGGWITLGTGSAAFTDITTGTNTTATMTVGSGAILSALNATRTAPSKSGTALPGTCTKDDTFIDNDATTTAQWYICTSTNTWTGQGGSATGLGDPGSNSVVYRNGAGTSAPATANNITDPLQCADAGGTDAYACSLSPTISGYVTGAEYKFKANTANTTAATLNLNTIGPITIKKVAGGVTTDLATNDIRANQWVTVTYDGTNFQMISQLGNAAVGGATTRRKSVLNWKTLPDTSGNVFFEPYTIKSTNDFFGVGNWIFNNPGADLKLYFSHEIDDTYVGTASFIVVWTSTIISGNFGIEIGYRCISGNDAESLDQATAQEVLNTTDVAPGATDRRMEISLALTSANCAAGDTIQGYIARDDSADTLAGAISLWDLMLTYSIQ
jgi:hypothetical protein